MISIRKAATDLDRMEETLRCVTEAYGKAVGSTAQYAIELDPGETAEFRQHLLGLQKQIEIAQAPEDWSALESSFRGELRVYSDRTAGRVERLRTEIKVAAQAVQLFLQSVAAIDCNHEVQIKEALVRLDIIAQSVHPEALQQGIRSAAQTISLSIEAMKKDHQIATAQLQDEIRLLHQQIEGERNAQFVDSATGVWNRQKLDSHVAALMKRDEPFCVLLVCVRNLPRLESRYSRTVIDGTLRALLQRFATMLEKGVMIGRRDEQTFAAILEMEPAAAIGVSRAASKKLTGNYAVQENGVSHTVTLQTVAGVIDRSLNSDEASFEQKLARMSERLCER